MRWPQTHSINWKAPDTAQALPYNPRTTFTPPFPMTASTDPLAHQAVNGLARDMARLAGVGGLAPPVSYPKPMFGVVGQQ